MNSNIAIQINDLCFAYENEMVLKHLTMDIYSDCVCFVMGNNGSGKTTLLKNLMGFLVPQNGEILLRGKNISSLDRHTMSRLISYVPQAIHHNTDFSVIDYLSLGRTPYTGFYSRLSDEDYQTIEKYSAKLDIESLFDIPFNKLSGGQKQIVAIGRSLIQETPFIIMDEPMSALDIGKQVEILKIFKELTRSGKTIILTTHNPNHALTIDSYTCFLNRGKIVKYGSSISCINSDLLHEIYGPNVNLDHGEKQDFVVFSTESE